MISDEQIIEIVRHKYLNEAEDSLKAIEQALSGDALSAGEKERYRKYQIKLQGVLIPRMTVEEVSELLSKYFLTWLKDEDLDLEGRLALFLMDYQGVIDDTRMDLLSGVEKNARETIGEEAISLKGGSMLKPTVANWIRNHIIVLGRGRKKQMELTNYFDKDKNVVKLEKEDKDTLRKLVRLYNLLQPLPIDEKRFEELSNSDYWWGVDFPEHIREIGVKKIRSLPANRKEREAFLEKQGQPITEKDKEIRQKVGDLIAAGGPSKSSGAKKPPMVSEMKSKPIDDLLQKKAKPFPNTAPLPSKPAPVKPPSIPAKDKVFQSEEKLGQWKPAVPADKPAVKKEEKAGEVNMNIKDALEKYPKVAEQSLSAKTLKLKDGTAIQPTVRGWLRDYIDEVGLDYHLESEREKYLLAGENAGLLAKNEKKRVRKVLASFDDNQKLVINPDTQKVVFK